MTTHRSRANSRLTKTRGAGLFAALLLLGACSSSDPPGPAPADGDTMAASDAGVDPDAGVGAATVTYYQDIAPLLQAKCVACHSPGGIAPFALDTAAAAQGHAAMTKVATQSREMPPWPPGPLSPRMLHERVLSDQEIALLSAWADAGAPLGDATHPAPPRQPEMIDIGTADLSSDIGVDYVADASLTDDYRCFLVDPGMTADRMIVGYRISPGNPKIVHHVITTLFSHSDRASLEALDAQTPDRAGWPCFGGPVPTDSGVSADGSLGGWVPGVSSVLLPARTGTAIHAGDLMVVQVHYNLAGGHAPDRTRIELKFAPTGTESTLQQLATIRLLRHNLNLTAGATNIVEENTFAARTWTLNKFYPDGDAYLLAVAGHMHTLGTHITLERRNAAGTTVLLDIPAWDFHWQGSYQLVEPIVLHADDQLTIRCVYDNTAARRAAQGNNTPVVDVHWGEGTADEMCLGYLTVVDRKP
jgi:mono/diheme cytochrome c family protein